MMEVLNNDILTEKRSKDASINLITCKDEPQRGIADIITKFSSWTKLKRVFSKCKRFTENYNSPLARIKGYLKRNSKSGILDNSHQKNHPLLYQIHQQNARPLTPECFDSNLPSVRITPYALSALLEMNMLELFQIKARKGRGVKDNEELCCLVKEIHISQQKTRANAQQLWNKLCQCSESAEASDCIILVRRKFTRLS
ncbi:hypothetical protein NPIL_234881 [Nephila pilipes]|uniref:Uncharacterized protein n=1 Tax=Nephila pilipes TaxID=299642 RepID=A0A8X6QK51_NEPPI|nr:hypothetical protein NPIL_234881 [Nephila pilipes]